MLMVIIKVITVKWRCTHIYRVFHSFTVSRGCVITLPTSTSPGSDWRTSVDEWSLRLSAHAKYCRFFPSFVFFYAFLLLVIFFFFNKLFIIFNERRWRWYFSSLFLIFAFIIPVENSLVRSQLAVPYNNIQRFQCMLPSKISSVRSTQFLYYYITDRDKIYKKYIIYSIIKVLLDILHRF